MAKSLSRLLIQVNHALVARIFSVANMSFNAIRENEILAKVSRFTVLCVLASSAGDLCKQIVGPDLDPNS